MVITGAADGIPIGSTVGVLLIPAFLSTPVFLQALKKSPAISASNNSGINLYLRDIVSSTLQH
jgi:hypothetical protein